MRTFRPRLAAAAAVLLVPMIALSACGGATSLSTITDQLGAGADDAAAARAGTIIGTADTTCGARLDINAGDIGVCRLRAGDSNDATVIIGLQPAAVAGKTRIVYLCDFTNINTVLTFRDAANLPWRTWATDYRIPQCGSGKAFQLRYEPEVYYPYVYQPDVVVARNAEVSVHIPSCETAYGWLCPFYNNPSVGVLVVDYVSTNVTPTIPQP